MEISAPDNDKSMYIIDIQDTQFIENQKFHVSVKYLHTRV